VNRDPIVTVPVPNVMPVPSVPEALDVPFVYRTDEAPFITTEFIKFPDGKVSVMLVPEAVPVESPFVTPFAVIGPFIEILFGESNKN
jgi:hypothetical protein